jgi:hypothetical protein
MNVANHYHRLFGLACAATLLSGAACAPEPIAPGAPSASLAGSSAQRVASVNMVAIKGTFESRPVVPSAQPCPAGSVRTGGAGEGIVSHLGRITQTITGCFSPATLTSTGDAVLVAANGDRLHLSVTSTFAPGGPAANAVVTTNGPIVGGTGRFAGATGFATIVTVFDPQAGLGTATLTGMMALARP